MCFLGFHIAILNIGMTSVFNTINIKIIIFLKKLQLLLCLSEIVRQISCCPSEYRIGIRTTSESRNFGFRLAPLVVSDHKLGFLQKLRLAHSCTCARAHPFLYLGNGWMDCAEIWCVARGPLAMHFTRDGDTCAGTRATVTHFSTSIRSRSFIAKKASYWFNAQWILITSYWNCTTPLLELSTSLSLLFLDLP